MRAWAAAAALLALAAPAQLRPDQDFEFDDDAEVFAEAAEAPLPVHSRRPRRYIYDPHNSLCQSLVCKRREVCLLRDAFTALCANKKDILRKGDTIVVGGAREVADDDVFYEGPGGDVTAGGPGSDVSAWGPGAGAGAGAGPGGRCVGCGRGARGSFLCGSDNRTYSSLCRLDLHNCLRRAPRPVTLACRGLCPCPRHPRARPREWRRRKAEAEHNEVVPAPALDTKECALGKMANRLVDWFSVLMEEAGETHAPEEGFPDDCKPEVRWMFAHLDTDGDGRLSADNLYALRHDERERCLRPFLSSCGGGDVGGDVTRSAWCACLRRGAGPCAVLARALAGRGASGGGGGGGYMPACDARGWYRARQCDRALGVCWCVDAHGAERPRTRTKGAPACPPAAAPTHTHAPPAQPAPPDDEDAPGSGHDELQL